VTHNDHVVITGPQLEALALLVSAKSHVLSCDVCRNPTTPIMNGHFVRLNCYCKELVCPVSGLCRKCHAGNMGTRRFGLKGTEITFSHGTSGIRADNGVQQKDSFSGVSCHC